MTADYADLKARPRAVALRYGSDSCRATASVAERNAASGAPYNFSIRVVRVIRG
jgi:hypothetical protein